MRSSTRLFCSFTAVVSFLALTAPGISGGKKVMTTEVTVLDAKGKSAGGRQVILEFEGPKGLAFTDPAFTTAKGVVKIKHILQGKVKVYVDGNHSLHRTTGQAPGKITVRLVRPEPFAAIDRHALKAPAEAEQSIESLATYLAGAATNDLDKVRAIYRWITDRISYDYDSLLGGTRGDNSPDGVLRHRKCVCQGYAELFEALAKKMDLEAVMVVGKVKKCGAGSGSVDFGLHGWNAAKVDGDWKLFDATFGAGAVIGQKWTKMPNDFFFQTPPELLLFSHFPEDANWQFREPPLPREEFDATPCVPREIFKMGLSADRIWKMIREDKVKEFCTFFSTPGREVIFREAPVAKTLKAGERYRFLVDAPEFSYLTFELVGQVGVFQKLGPLFEGYVAPRAGVLNVRGSNQQGRVSIHSVIASYQVE
jgi:hypothetical protein